MTQPPTTSCFSLAVVSLSVRSISCAEFSKKLRRFVEQAHLASAKLILFPEFCIAPILEETNGDCYQATVFLEKTLAKLAIEYGIYICGGSGHYLINSKTYNQSFLINVKGEIVYQPKINLIESEKAEGTTGGNELKVISTPFVKLAICVCYDIEFPELVRQLVLRGVDLILNPSYTLDRYGENRVQYCAQARAVENHIYVAKSCLVGTDGYIKTSTGYGRSALYSPIDLAYPEDGIVAQTQPNTEELLITNVDLTKLHLLRMLSSTSPLRDYRNLQLDKKHIEDLIL